MPGFSAGKLWNVKKGDSITVNALKLKVLNVESLDSDGDHEEATKEIHLSGNHLLEVSDSLRTFYKIEHLDSFNKKKTEIPIHTIDPE